MGGVFISLEGMEGAGKSTHVRLLGRHLENRGVPVVLTAEPGGVAVSKAIRGVLLDVAHSGMDPMTELLLYAAARREHLEKLILPALAEGKVVVTDRFSDSTRAYQGAGRGLDAEAIEALDRMVTGGRKPDLTILLDLKPEVGLARNRRSGEADRIEMEKVDFHRRVREGFLAIQASEPGRVKLVDAGGSIEMVQGEIRRLVDEALQA